MANDKAWRQLLLHHLFVFSLVWLQHGVLASSVLKESAPADKNKLLLTPPPPPPNREGDLRDDQNSSLPPNQTDAKGRKPPPPPPPLAPLLRQKHRETAFASDEIEKPPPPPPRSSDTPRFTQIPLPPPRFEGTERRDEQQRNNQSAVSSPLLLPSTHHQVTSPSTDFHPIVPNQLHQKPSDFQQSQVSYNQGQAAYHQQRQLVPQQRRVVPGIRRGAPVWKSLWRKVELGLDGLADIEEKVSTQASTIGSSLVERTMTWRSGTPPNPSHRKPSRKQIRVKKELVQKPSEQASLQLIGSFGAKYKNLDDTQLEQKREAKYEKLRSESRKVDWNKIVGTNGASPQMVGAGGDTPPNANEAAGSFTNEMKGSRRPEILQAAATPVATQSNSWKEHIPSTEIEDEKSSIGPLDEDESQSIWSSLPKFRLPRFPSPIMSAFGRGSGSFQRYSQNTMDQWNEKLKFSNVQKRRTRLSMKRTDKMEAERQSVTSQAPAVSALLDCPWKSGSFVSHQDSNRAYRIGREKAMFDLVQLSFILFGLHEFGKASIFSILESGKLPLSQILPKMATHFSALQESWVLHCFSAAVLTAATRHLLLEKRSAQRLCSQIGATIMQRASSAQVYMRLLAGIPINKQLPQRLFDAVEAHCKGRLAAGRLESFVLAIAFATLLSVSKLRLVSGSIMKALRQLILLECWRTWPIEFNGIMEGFKRSVLPELSASLNEVLTELRTLVETPHKAALQISFLGAIASVLVIAAVERRRPFTIQPDDDQAGEFTGEETLNKISNLGASSASRISLLARPGAIDSIIRFWNEALSYTAKSPSSSRQIGSGLRSWALLCLAGSILAAPIILYFFASERITLDHFCAPNSFSISWNSVLDVSCLLLIVFEMFSNALKTSMWSHSSKGDVFSFGSSLDEVVSSTRRSTKRRSQAINEELPGKGLSVRDLWAAHTSKRAWAVRGVTLDASAGEVVLVLGEDGCGKSHLLTAIAESILEPPSHALTTTKVRGAITLGGIDSSKWDMASLERKLTVFLKDIRTVNDSSSFLSGLTLEEILEPTSISNSADGEVRARNCINRSLAISGLSTTLIPRLPTKLASTVAGGEERLRPFHRQFIGHSLSADEWSKLLLSRVVAQALFDSDRGTADRPLLGAIFLLDDVGAAMNEVDEARLIQELRGTGAATLMSSNRWAAGRFADRIIVLKDGAILEVGSHNELLTRGPQLSAYASMWHLMTQS